MCKRLKDYWDQLIMDVLINFEFGMKLVLTTIFAIISVMITWGFYVAAFNSKVNSKNDAQEDVEKSLQCDTKEIDYDSALDAFIDDINISINFSFLIILLILFVATSITLLILFYLGWKLATKEDYFTKNILKIILISFAISFIFMISHTLDVNSFSVLVGILSVFALSAQAANLFLNIDKK